MVAGFRDELDGVLRESGGRFGHREHLHLAWRYVRGADPDEAADRKRAAIQHVAGVHQDSNRYHETMTFTWLKLVTVHLKHSDETDFDAFLAANEGLLDRTLPTRHFSRELLESAAARSALVEPDLAPLPA